MRARLLHGRLGRLGLAILLAAPVLSPVRAQAVPEYTLKAAFVYNFALFADWPEGGGETFTVCVNLESPLRGAIEEFHDRPIKGRRLLIRARQNLENTRGCHVLFLDRIDRERWPAIRRALAGDAVLTVTDDQEIAREGAMIGLATVEGRIAFDVDSAAARSAKIVLSSKLLRLARSVR